MNLLTTKSVTFHFKRTFRSSVSLSAKMLRNPLNAFSPNLNFPRLVVFAILQFKINNFSLISVLPFYHYCDRRLTLESWLAFVEKQLVLQF